MSPFLLDPDTLSLLQHHNVAVLSALSTVKAGGHTVGLTIISIEEQMDGWTKAMRAAKTGAQLARASRSLAEAVPVWATFRIYPMTEAAIVRFEQLVGRKLNVGRMDLRIAAIALEAGATVVTHNVRDFTRVPDLTVVDWTEPLSAPTQPAPQVPPNDAPKS